MTVFFSIFFPSSVRRLEEKIIINLKIDDDDDDVAEDNVKVMNEKKSVECRFPHIKNRKKLLLMLQFHLFIINIKIFFFVLYSSPF